MTKTKNQKSRASSHNRVSAHRYSWLLALVIIIIIIAIALLVIFLLKPQPIATPEEPNNPTISSTSKSDEQPSSQPETSNEPTPAPESPEKTSQYEGEDPNQLDELTGVIISKDIDNGVLSVMVTINQYLQQDGKCAMTLTGHNSGNTYTVFGDTHANIQTSYCETLEIPVSNLVSDTYDIEIKLASDGKTGTIRDEVKL